MPILGQPSSSNPTIGQVSASSPIPSTSSHAIPSSVPNFWDFQPPYHIALCPLTPYAHLAHQSTASRPSSNSHGYQQPTIPSASWNMPLPPRNSMSAMGVASLVARKHVAESLAMQEPTAKKPRKHRTCTKCAQPDCPGSQKVQNCRNPCRDCGVVQCQGRNSKQPNEPCHLRND